VRTPFLSSSVLTFGAPRAASSEALRLVRDAHRPKFGEAVCCVEIPIVGGLLANADPSEEDRGCLRFTWLRTETHRERTGEIVLVTEIAGGYRPSLAGNTLPAPLWRKAMYCSTQRMVHAYVMWRFHGFAVGEYRRRVDGM